MSIGFILKFYELLRTYKHTEDEKFIYLEFEPVNYEFAKHLISYEDDKITIKELYHLNQMGFEIQRDICKYELYDKDCFIVDRKTRKVTYPDRIINLKAKHYKLGQDALNIMQLVIFDDYTYSKKIVDTDFKIDGYDYSFIKIDDDLFTFDRFKYDDNYRVTEVFAPLCQKAYTEYDCSMLYICGEAKFDFKTFYARFSKEHNVLHKYAKKESK